MDPVLQLQNMYIDVERMLCECKVACHIPSPMWVDKRGKEVGENHMKLAYGCKVKTVLDLPQCCLICDEVGGDMNMLQDGAQGGTKYISREGECPRLNSSKKSKRLTVLGVTALTGQPVMCVIIFEGKERNVLLESGIDPFHPMLDDYEGDLSESNFKFFEDNY